MSNDPTILQQRERRGGKIHRNESVCEYTSSSSRPHLHTVVEVVGGKSTALLHRHGALHVVLPRPRVDADRRRRLARDVGGEHLQVLLFAPPLGARLGGVGEAGGLPARRRDLLALAVLAGHAGSVPELGGVLGLECEPFGLLDVPERVTLKFSVKVSGLSV